MNWIDGETIFEEYLSDTLHGDTQIESDSVSLTAGAIHNPIEAGDLDFGGSEFQLAERDAVPTVKRNDDDDYGWWELPGGDWILELNETVTYSDGFSAVLQAHDHLTWNGATHPTIWLSDDEANMRLLVPLHVPDAGVNIKENARVSSLRVAD